MRILLQNLEVTQLSNVITGKVVAFVDTLPVLKDASEPPGAPHGHSLGAVHQRLFGEPISNTRDAFADVKAPVPNSAEGQAGAMLYLEQHYDPRC